MQQENNLWLPPPDLTISDWADEYRRIPPEASAEPGFWNTDRAPYQREMMNAVSDALIERVIMMTAAQVGKTEIILNTIGYFIDKEPSPILLLNPTLEMGESFSKDRLAPMIRDTPALTPLIKDPRTRDSGNTLLHKKFPGGHITIAGANSPASLASRPIRVLLCDEVDRYPQSAGAEGDPLSLAMKRTQNFWNRRVVWVSTPTLKNISRIEKAFEISSQEEWEVPCPNCGNYTAYKWELIEYKDKTEPVMKCPHCGKYFSEVEWKTGSLNGRWTANNLDAKNIRGFHVNSFASPWVTWRSLCDQYQEAYTNGEDELKVWINTVLGIPYENTAGAIEVTAMKEHREEYGAELPEGVLVLTCGVDTQDDRLECEVVGWGLKNESWGIAYKVFYGDPGQPELWEQLDNFLARDFHYADGNVLNISCTCIDSGGHFTDEVYKFCKLRSKRRIFPIVGRGTFGRAIVSKPSINNRRRVRLFTLGVSTIKGVLFSRLQAKRNTGGYCHFPDEKATGHRGYDNEYFKGLLSERQVLKRSHGRVVVEWEYWNQKARNEPLDCRVYAIGAFEILNPNMEGHAEKRQRQKFPVKSLTDMEKKAREAVLKLESEINADKKPVKRAVRVMRKGFMI